MRPVPRETSVVTFPSSNPLPSFEDLPESVSPERRDQLGNPVADDPGAPEPVSTPSEQPAPQGTHCPAGLCPRCWEGGVQVATARDREDTLFCPRCEWTPQIQRADLNAPLGAIGHPGQQINAAPPAFQTLLLPHRAPGVDPMLHVAFWAGRPHEVLAIASPETVSCGSLALPPGARVFFLREMPR